MLTRYRPRTFALELLMIAVALLFAYPVYVLVNLSLKNPHEIAEASIGPPSHLETSNYSNAWNGAHLGAAMLNSTIITVVSLLCLIMIGSTAAYYLARTQSRLSYGMYLLFLLGIVLPFQLALVPALPVHEGHRPARLLHLDGALLHRPADPVHDLPLHRASCARCRASTARPRSSTAPTHWQSFTRVTFPLLRPVTGTVVILNAVFIWNDFLTPLIYLGGTAERDAAGRRLPVRRPVRLQLGLHLRRRRHGVASHPARLPAPAALRDQGLRQRTEGLSMRASRAAVRAPRGHTLHRRPGPAPELGSSSPMGGDQRQTGYRIVVEHDGDTLWDSGMVDGSAYRRRRLRRSPAAVRRRAVHVDACRSGIRTTACPTGAIRRAFASVSPRGPRPGSARSPITTRRCPSPGDGGEVGPRRRDARPASAVPLLPPSVPAARDVAARRCTPRHGACWHSSSTADVSATRSSRRVGPITARGSSTRRTT